MIMAQNKPIIEILVKDFSTFLPGSKGAEILSSSKFFEECWWVFKLFADGPKYESYENFASYLLQEKEKAEAYNDVLFLVKFKSNESLIREALQEGFIKFVNELKLVNHQ